MLKSRGSDRKSQQGVSLVELMVGMVVGFLVIVAAGAMFISTNITGRDALNAAKVNAEARGAMDLMVEEIRRAGASEVAGAANPYTRVGQTDMAVFNAGACIVFGIDRNWNSNTTPTENNEFTGFSVNNGELRVLTTAADATACPANNWQPITDRDRVEISPLDGEPYFEVLYQCMNSRTDAVSPANPSADATARCVAGNAVFDGANVAGAEASDLLESRQVRVNFCATLDGEAACAAGTTRLQMSQTVLVKNYRILTLP